MSWNKVGRVSSKNGSRRDHAATGVRIATYLRAVCCALCVNVFSEVRGGG